MDELTEHYALTVRLIERTLLCRVPRWCRITGLSPDEVTAIAEQLAKAHQLWTARPVAEETCCAAEPIITMAS